MSAPPVRSGTGARVELFFEDLTPGRTFDLGIVTVDRDEMVAFARRFDPQWYHVDEELARQSHHGGIIASGFFTISLFMRAYVDQVLSRAAADASPGLEELRWLAPVRAGDRLAVRLDVMGRKPSTARPGLGTVTLTGTMLRLDADGRPECEVLRTRFRGWFTLREEQHEQTAPHGHAAPADQPATSPVDAPTQVLSAPVVSAAASVTASAVTAPATVAPPPIDAPTTVIPARAAPADPAAHQEPAPGPQEAAATG